MRGLSVRCATLGGLHSADRLRIDSNRPIDAAMDGIVHFARMQKAHHAEIRSGPGSAADSFFASLPFLQNACRHAIAGRIA